jgi:hypothetical protein
MNIVLNTTDFDTSAIYFTEAKINTHLENSTFNRITYSTDNFIMSGIYIQFELYMKYNEKNFNNNVYIYHIDQDNEHNKSIIKSFSDIENKILHKWDNCQKCSKIHKKDILKQLNDGAISVWKHDACITEKPAFHQFIIKISGVWENDNETGLTYKFI